MTGEKVFLDFLETKVFEQLQSQRVGYLLGAGSSYLDSKGYPLAFELWDNIKELISEKETRNIIQSKLDNGALGLEAALDLLDDGGAMDIPYRHIVTEAIAKHFQTIVPPLENHIEFLHRLSLRGDPCLDIFSLNYDPLVERAAEKARIRLIDGFYGIEQAYFDPALFNERIGQIRGSYRSKQFSETVKPLHLLKLHGSLGWYECQHNGIRRCSFSLSIPNNTRRLMVPPQRRKVIDTLDQPYAALWSTFRGCLAHNSSPINRLACFGYGFNDEHVNAVIESALSRTDFTLLIFSKVLSEKAWNRWSIKTNVVVVTEKQCSNKGEIGPGHKDLWRFEKLSREV